MLLAGHKSSASLVASSSSSSLEDGAGFGTSVSNRLLLPWALASRRFYQFWPMGRNRSVICLFVYVIAVAFASYLLLGFLSSSYHLPCFTCKQNSRDNDYDFPAVAAKDAADETQEQPNRKEPVNGEMMNSILKQLRERVVKLANISSSSSNDGGNYGEVDGVDYVAIGKNGPIPKGASRIEDAFEDEKISQAPPLDPQVESAIDVLQAVVDQPFTDEAKEFEKTSLHFYGLQARLDRAFMKLLFDSTESGRRKLRIAAVGGSITVGNGIPKKAGYFDHFIKWLSKPLKEHGIDLVFNNAAIGASGSEYFSMCINEYFNLTEVDILLVEFAFNDGRYLYYMSGYQPDGARPLEELVRAVWRKNPMIHIVLINFPFIKNIFRLYYPPKCESIEDDLYLKVAQHYQLTSIRWKHLFCNNNVNMTKQQQKTLAEKYIASDGNHPSTLVHQQMAEFLVYYFRTSLQHTIERLRMGRGASTVGGMILADEATIDEHSSRLTGWSASPLYKTAWIDASDCFASFDRPFRRNNRLSKALLNASADFNPDNVFTIAMIENGTEEIGDNLQLFILDKSPSFLSFRFDGLINKLPCKNGYDARLAIVYTLCKDCSPGELRLFATFVLEDHSIFNTTFRVKLKSHGYKTNYVHLLPPLLTNSGDGEGNYNVDYSNNINNNGDNTVDRGSSSLSPRFCRGRDQPLIDTIHVRIEQMSVNYPLLLHAVVVAYDCCQEMIMHV